MRFEVTTWIDTTNPDAEEFPQRWGVQVHGHNGRGLLSENGRVVEFDNPADAAEKVRALRGESGE